MRLLPVLFLLFGKGKCPPPAGTLPDPTMHPNWGLLDDEVCGESLSDRIIGGMRADMGQFPWMARLGYINPPRQPEVTKAKHFRCGGTLISHMYVLTAAHCVCGERCMGSRKLALVRLGEFDARTEVDCDGDVCMPKPQDFRPQKIFHHERFDPKRMHNDVALVRLDKPVTYNQYVTPICLPHGRLMDRNHVPEVLTVAGWGVYNMTVKDMSDILYYVNVPLKDITVCRKSMPQEMVIGLGQICAGGQRGRDSCGGDSGGPLMAPAALDSTPKFFQFGLVSFGTDECGVDVPAIYTDVAYFLQWILDKMEP